MLSIYKPKASSIKSLSRGYLITTEDLLLNLYHSIRAGGDLRRLSLISLAQRHTSHTPNIPISPDTACLTYFFRNLPMTEVPQPPVMVVPVQNHSIATKFSLVFNLNFLCCRLASYSIFCSHEHRQGLFLSKLSFYIFEYHNHDPPLFFSKLVTVVLPKASCCYFAAFPSSFPKPHILSIHGYSSPSCLLLAALKHVSQELARPCVVRNSPASKRQGRQNPTFLILYFG